MANRDALDSRSPFFPPAEPPRIVKPIERPIDTDKPAPTKGPYNGPKLIGLAADQAVFDKPLDQSRQYLGVGEKGGGLELLSVDLPWNAKVRWMTFEYELNLFDRIELGTAFPIPGGVQPLSNAFNTNRRPPSTPAAAPNAGTAASTFEFSVDDNSDGGLLFEDN
jgi:hypothetical protein